PSRPGIAGPSPTASSCCPRPRRASGRSRTTATAPKPSPAPSVPFHDYLIAAESVASLISSALSAPKCAHEYDVRTFSVVDSGWVVDGQQLQDAGGEAVGVRAVVPVVEERQVPLV